MSVARWIFQSPTRVVLAALSALALLVGTLAVTSGGSQAPSVRPAVAATLAPLDPATATKLGQEFVALWCEQGDRTPDQWVTEMRARSTPAFGQYWTTASIAHLAGDCPWGQAKPRLTVPARVRVFVDWLAGVMGRAS